MTKKSLVLIILIFYVSYSMGYNFFSRPWVRIRRESPDIDTCDPPEIENGKFEVLGSSVYKEGGRIPNYALLKITCKQYYALYPENNTHANCVNGNWLADLPKCIRTCPARISASVDVTCTLNNSPVNCSKPVFDGTVAISKCKTFYTPTEPMVLPITTCEEGVWSGSLVRCAPDCGETASKGKVNIVHGLPAERGEFPWHVGVYRHAYLTKSKEHKYMYSCGGTIVSLQVVITAAHCLTSLDDGKRKRPSLFYIAAGKYYSAYKASGDKHSQKRQVKEYYVPPHYKGLETNYAGDLAVVIVKEPFAISDTVRPICMDWNDNYEREQLISEALGSVAGWGFNSTENFDISETLMKLNVPFIGTETCLKVVPPEYRRWVTPDKICAGYTNGSSVCGGDSGSGLVFPWTINNKEKYFLRGVVSGGPIKNGTCDDEQYGVYTRISMYNQFILHVIQKNSDRDTRTYATGFGSCTEPIVSNGKFDLLNTKYEEGFPIPNYSFLAVYCNESYGLFPQTSYVLCINGSWHIPVPECRKKCPLLLNVQNCTVDGIEVPCDEARVQGAEVESKCNSTITSHCINGVWNTSIPSCSSDDDEDYIGGFHRGYPVFFVPYTTPRSRIKAIDTELVRTLTGGDY